MKNILLGRTCKSVLVYIDVSEENVIKRCINFYSSIQSIDTNMALIDFTNTFSTNLSSCPSRYNIVLRNGGWQCRSKQTKRELKLLLS